MRSGRNISRGILGRMKKRKLALVMSGGAMRCVYGVGVLSALVEEYGLTEPDIIVASSGSVANAAYYLSGQYTCVIAAWLDVIASKKFISYGRRKVVDIDYLVDEVFKKQFPFDFKALKRAKTAFVFATTRVKDGKTVYMKLPKDRKIYECLRAAKAVPFIYGKDVSIGKNLYFDGDFGSNTEDLVMKALELGATDLIIVENNPEVKNSRTKRVGLDTLYLESRVTGRQGAALAALRELEGTKALVFPKGVKSVWLEPEKPLFLLERHKRYLRAGFNQGYDDAVNSKELRTLLTK